MSIERGLVERITGTSGLAALVGDRVYPGSAPQDAPMPYLTYSRVFTSRKKHLRGTVGMPRAVFQLDIWSLTYSVGKQIAALLRPRLDGQLGTWGGVEVLATMLDDESEIVEPPSSGDEAAIYRTSIDLAIWYTEPTVTL